jgi:hypothetical protein
MKAWMPGQPGYDFGMLVGGAVVNDQVQFLVVGRLAIDSLEEPQRLWVPMEWIGHREPVDVLRSRPGTNIPNPPDPVSGTFPKPVCQTYRRLIRRLPCVLLWSGCMLRVANETGAGHHAQYPTPGTDPCSLLPHPSGRSLRNDLYPCGGPHRLPHATSCFAHLP